MAEGVATGVDWVATAVGVETDVVWVAAASDRGVSVVVCVAKGVDVGTRVLRGRGEGAEFVVSKVTPAPLIMITPIQKHATTASETHDNKMRRVLVDICLLIFLPP